MKNRLSIVSMAAFLTIVVGSSASAQFPLPGSSNSAPAAAEVAAVPDGLRSARATMQTFLMATVAAADDAQRHRIADAVACLELAGIPVAAREDAGPELAIKLKEIIDRVRLVDYATIPDEANGSPYVFFQDEKTRYAIVIDRTADGQWRFSSDTVVHIDALYRSLSSRARVAGVGAAPSGLSPSLWLRERMPDVLKDKAFLMENWQWLMFFAVIVLGLILGRLSRWILRRPSERWLANREFNTPSD
ncbi:MAG: hypothetical protein ACI9MR_005024, partial [Myxococcota bacterium]